MKFNKNDIEYYLLTKEYDALSLDELKLVREAIATKEEYNSMRQLLLVMEEAPVENELVPKPEIKESLIAAFEKTRWEQGIGTKNDVKVIPIQQEERRNKGFFWFSIAASIVLLVGLFFNREYLFMPDNKELAMLDDHKVDENEVKTLEKEIHKEKNDIDAESAFEEPVELEEKVIDVANELAENRNVGHTIEEEQELKREAPAFNFSTEAPLAGVNQQEGNQLASNENNSTKMFDLDEAADAEVGLVVADEIAEEFDDMSLSSKELSSVTVETQSNDKAIRVYESKSLQGDKEMIEVFYTAL